MAIVDCGIGNLFSIECALKRLGVDAFVFPSSRRLQDLDAIVLPGVGNFAVASESVQFLRPEIAELVDGGTPVLGICLGMQLLFETSEEGSGSGLGLLEGKVLRLPKHVRIPHMGWNTLRIRRCNELVDGVDDQDYFYFVHGYYANPTRKQVVVAETDYGLDFASVVAEKNIHGIQCHPEKSGKPGERILRNFVNIIKR